MCVCKIGSRWRQESKKWRATNLISSTASLVSLITLTNMNLYFLSPLALTFKKEEREKNIWMKVKQINDTRRSNKNIELNRFYWLRFLIHIIYTNKEYFKSQLLQLVQNDNGECWKSTTSRVVVELHSFYKEFWKISCQQASSLF